MDNKFFTKKGSKVEIEEVHTSSGLEYDINFNGGTDYYTVAKCWDYLLAEKIRDAVSDYMQENYKVVGQEDAEMLEESLDEPIMPGVLQVEAMAQVGGILVLSSVDEPEKYSTYFLKIDNVKFRNKVVPGDTLIFHLSLMTPIRRGTAVMKGYAFVGEKIVTEAEFMAQIVKNKE